MACIFSAHAFVLCWVTSSAVFPGYALDPWPLWAVKMVTEDKLLMYKCICEGQHSSVVMHCCLTAPGPWSHPELGFLTSSVPVLGSTSTATLTKIKWLLKMNVQTLYFEDPNKIPNISLRNTRSYFSMLS